MKTTGCGVKYSAAGAYHGVESAALVKTKCLGRKCLSVERAERHFLLFIRITNHHVSALTVGAVENVKYGKKLLEVQA